MRRELSGKGRALVLLLLTAAAALSLVLAVGRFPLRLDLSADRSNSLSQAAGNLRESIPERVRLTYFISSRLAERHPGPRAVEDLLREFEAASRGKITVEVVDPGKDPAEAEALGVAAQRMQVVEENEQRVAMVYSGLVVSYLDRTEVLPFVLDPGSLEYELIKAIRKAVTQEAQVASILVGDADKSFANDYRTLAQALEQSGWEARELARGAPVPPETKVLLVLGNAALGDYETYQIDSYLARGGRAVFAVKGVDVEARQSLTAAPLAEDALLRALESYGVKVRRELVLDQSSLTVPFQTARQGGGSMVQYVRYPHWIVVRPENASRDNPVTARFPGLDLFWASPLELLERPGVKASVLASTTPKAWLMTKDFALAPEDEFRFANEEEATRGKYSLVVEATGALPSAYAGRPRPEREGALPLEPLPDKPFESRILVVGSADFSNDLMTMTDSTFNAVFLAGMTEWLSSGDELAAVRSRGNRDPRLTRIQDPVAKSLVILAAYATSLVLVPGGIALFGWLRARKRRLLATRAPGFADDGEPAPLAAAARSASSAAPAFGAAPDVVQDVAPGAAEGEGDGESKSGGAS